MTFPREPRPIWQHPKRISVNHFVSLRLIVSSSALRRATTHAANPCLTTLAYSQTALPPSLEQRHALRDPVLLLLHCKIHRLHALVLPVLPLRFPIIFCNSGSHSQV